MSAHTPGPWIRDRLVPCGIPRGNEWAEIKGADSNSSFPVAMVKCDSQMNQADLRLILAAPDLLKELRKAIGYIKQAMEIQQTGAEEDCASACAVIAKVEGKA